VDRTPRDSMRNTGTMGNEMMTMGTVGNEITSRREFDSAVHTGNRLIVPEEDQNEEDDADEQDTKRDGFFDMSGMTPVSSKLQSHQ